MTLVVSKLSHFLRHPLGILFAALTLLTSCNQHKNFRLLLGSENEALQPLIKDFADKKGYDIDFVYKGSVDIMLALQSDTTDFDGVWPASGLWITLGDQHHKVKYAKSILTSPVVFGIKKSLARQLNFIGRPVKVADILTAIRNRQLKFMMTSASQSNSGASAYFGFLYALLGNPEYITKDDLHKPELKEQIRELLSGINRSSGSSGWLKDLFLQGNGQYDAMVNYESIIIETNQELLRRNQEPLYVVYPTDGLVIADSQLGFVDRSGSDNNSDGKDKETFFRQLQDYLLSSDVQAKLLQLGRRTGFAGELTNAPPDVFRADWGIDTKKILSPIKLPGEDVIREALSLYQTDFRKPSFTVFCLDFSGSMNTNGGADQVKQAMQLLLDQDQAKRYFLQASDDDRLIIIPFNHDLITEWEADGNQGDSLKAILQRVTDLYPSGGTDIYSPVIRGLEAIKQGDTADHYIPAIILMTDGESNTGKTYPDLSKAWTANGLDIPVFAITFGDASDDQLNQIVGLTRASLFDGKKDLITAFRKAKGYN
ncbi:VWA domain-containing protein [Puia dinghuensis]|uniref:VWA domain-containing protein n=1 Tax=Puia dinghuensis TaxID=1792502 RepID=UPI00166A662A|nr:VWA domain-containing protein [Puia dinghuensis]